MPDVAMHSLTEKIVEKQLDCRVEAIEKVMSGDVITFVGSLLDGSDVVFRDQVEESCSVLPRHFGTTTRGSNSSYPTSRCQQGRYW